MLIGWPFLTSGLIGEFYDWFSRIFSAIECLSLEKLLEPHVLMHLNAVRLESSRVVFEYGNVFGK